jgi:hypothetical protein
MPSSLGICYGADMIQFTAYGREIIFDQRTKKVNEMDAEKIKAAAELLGIYQGQLEALKTGKRFELRIDCTVSVPMGNETILAMIEKNVVDSIAHTEAELRKLINEDDNELSLSQKILGLDDNNSS